ncbi:hypothetical protein Z517_05927 [Fonsecaea pedrosoi CBS 271.37]|uniref:Myb-like DNA-binding domain-containing protein n=1 Tax=Fonsecaea pedrosoi CBS 271.37 TaxID=1442368 RepID=A0A0D2GLC6_9EURO|nr:uncharacterized protein Z517_05927 [Fonsecaea pedrosoi CBS 271.37]KIW79315.1 hypothetical protein Z517_05927 [Fonsecaea pedrosoi CBS 271.37]
MSRATPDDQLRFLLSCVKHATHGRVDFMEVAKECGVISKGAAAKRYERLAKANGVSSTSASATSPVSKPTQPKQKARHPEEKPSASKKQKLERHSPAPSRRSKRVDESSRPATMTITDPRGDDSEPTPAKAEVFNRSLRPNPSGPTGVPQMILPTSLFVPSSPVLQGGPYLARQRPPFAGFPAVPCGTGHQLVPDVPSYPPFPPAFREAWPFTSEGSGGSINGFEIYSNQDYLNPKSQITQPPFPVEAVPTNGTWSFAEDKMPAKNRPAKRVLNRWSDDLDKGVLLCVQYACAEAGLKIPWSRVATLMGPTFTEGSIVQHLAKLRNLMAHHGIPVPPAVKRGMVTKELSKIYTNAGNKVKLEVIPPMFPAVDADDQDEGEEKGSIYDKAKRARKKEAPKEKDVPVKKEPKSKGKGKGKAKGRRHQSSDEEDNEPVPDLYDSDEEYPTPKKRRNDKTKAKKVAEASAALDEAKSPTPSSVEATIVDNHKAIKQEEEELVGSTRRIRGIKRDYAIMAAPSDDEAGVDEEVPEYLYEEAEGSYGSIDVDEDDGGSDDTDEASSEASTIILGGQQVDSHILGQQNVAGLPYGQIISTTTAPFTHLNTSNAGTYGHHGHIGVGLIHNPYSVPGLGYSGATFLNPVPQAYPASQFQSVSMYGSSTDSSRNNSIAAGMMFTTLPSMSDNEFLTPHTGFGHGNTGDVINEEDMMNSTANDDIFWNASDYLVDDA